MFTAGGVQSTVLQWKFRYNTTNGNSGKMTSNSGGCHIQLI